MKPMGCISPADDRRHYVTWSSVTPGDFPEGYWKTLYAWFDHGGRQHVAAYLMRGTGPREQDSERVHETHARLHRQGRVVGGRVFGYRNRVIYNGVDRDGNPLRSHVEREIDPHEAAGVRRTFTLFGDGDWA